MQFGVLSCIVEGWYQGVGEIEQQLKTTEILVFDTGLKRQDVSMRLRLSLKIRVWVILIIRGNNKGLPRLLTVQRPARMQPNAASPCPGGSSPSPKRSSRRPARLRVCNLNISVFFGILIVRQRWRFLCVGGFRMKSVEFTISALRVSKLLV